MKTAATLSLIRMLGIGALLPCAAYGNADFVDPVGSHRGQLDPSFGNGGILYFPLSENGSCLAGANAIAVHPDQSIWIAGWARQAPYARDAAFIKLAPNGHFLADDFGYEQTDLRAIAIDPATGEVYMAGNHGNIVYVRAFNADASFDTHFGTGGITSVAINGDIAHQTTVTDLQLDPGGSLYLAGGYNGTGVEQSMLAYIHRDGTLEAAEAKSDNSTDFVATALAIQPPSGRLLVSGYTQAACADDAFDVTFASGYHFTSDASYTSPHFGFAGTTGCFIDTSALLNDNGSLIDAGRVSNSDGSWTAMWKRVAANGVLSYPGHLFNMSPWGDNSPRKIILVPNGDFVDDRFVVVGFTGVDESGSPGAWAGGFLIADGSVDSRFGTNGATLINFDPQDRGYGYAFGAAMDRFGRILMTGTHYTGVSDADGNDCSEIFIARLQSGDLIFADGFE